MIQNMLKRLRLLWETVSRRIFGLEGTNVWVRFLLLPIIIILVFVFSLQLARIAEKAINLLISDSISALDGVQLLLRSFVNIFFPQMTLAVLPPKPPIFVTVLNWISEFGGENLQLLLLASLTLWLAYRLMVGYVYYIYDLDHFGEAEQLMSSAFLPFRRRNVVIENGSEKGDEGLSIREMFGGTVAFTIDAGKGYAAVMERPGTRIQILGPQDRYPVVLGGFLHLRQVIDLRTQHLRVSTSARTRDGVPVRIQQVQFDCSLVGLQVEHSKVKFLNSDPDVIHKLVYNHWVGTAWEKPVKRRKALNDLVSTALNEFIAAKDLVELLPYLDLTDANLDSQAASTPHLFDQFASFFNSRTGEHGLQLQWTGEGVCRLEGEFNQDAVRKHFKSAYTLWQYKQVEHFDEYGRNFRRSEVRRLVQHILRLFQNLQESGLDGQNGSVDKASRELSAHFLERLQNAMRILRSRGEQPPKEWLDCEALLDRLLTQKPGN